MATVNYSVPDEVKELFNETFGNRNKSAIIAELMVRAVEEDRQQVRRARAVDRLLARRDEKEAVSREQIRAARDELRDH